MGVAGGAGGSGVVLDGTPIGLAWVPGRGRSRAALWATGRTGEYLWAAALSLTLGLAVATALLGAGSPIMDRPAVFITARVVGCVGLVAIAQAMYMRGSSRRMATLILATAGSLALTGLTAVNAPLPFTLGRIAVPVAILLVSYVCFSYPSGRIEQPSAARLVAVSAVTLGTLQVAILLLSRVQPVAGPFVRCSGAVCPHNPLAIAGVGRGLGNALSIALAFATVLTLAGVAALTAGRAARATQLQRLALAPLLVWAVLTPLGYAFYLAVRAVSEHAALLTPAAMVVAALIALLPFAIGLGIRRGRLFEMAALERIVAELGAVSSPLVLQLTMSRAFADPSLQLLFRHPSGVGYVDVGGRSIDPASIDPRRTVTTIAHGETLAAVVHDPLLSDHALEAAASAVRLALDAARLQSELSESIEELAASRERVALAADEERRRIEQDLHDGAQQGLVALRLKLQLLEELAAEDHTAALGPGLADASERVDKAIADIRSLARGIYPPPLRDLGLAPALGALARELPNPVRSRINLKRRFPAAVETAVYFCCAEALQNVSKHCGPATRVELSASEARDVLAFRIADEGPGFDPALIGTSRGLMGMSDRLEAIGGQLTIHSAPGIGTTVVGRAPASRL